jgi:serine protease
VRFAKTFASSVIQGKISPMRISGSALRVAAGLVAAGALSAPVLASGATATTQNTVSTLQGIQGHKILFPMRGAASSTSFSGIQRLGNAGALTPSPALVYGGGTNGIGVTTGQPEVYVVFWGSQWGSATTSGLYTVPSVNSDFSLRLEQMYSGFGTNGELWSGVMTQYCEGVAAGTTLCPGTAPHVAYPSANGVLAGVWIDNSAAAPYQATDNQVATEAYLTANRFGNFTPALNRNAQYIVVSPTGTHPGGFNLPSTSPAFCAWHSWASSPYGDFAFTNMPYVLDGASGCGANFVNSGTAGLLDGVTIVAGHEYAETLTDQLPSGGWIDSAGAENSDKCAWIAPGNVGASQDVAFTPGGVAMSIAMQSTWSNATNTCAISAPIVTTTTTTTTTSTTTTTVPATTTTTSTTTTTVPATTTTTSTTTTTVPAHVVHLANPGTLRVKVKTAYRLVLTASDSQGQSLTLRATGLPRGISLVRSSKTIAGTATKLGSYSVTVKATDASGISASVTFTMIVNTTGATPSVRAAAKRAVLHRHHRHHKTKPVVKATRKK